MIHFAGGGNMATAMIEGLEGLDVPPQLAVIDPSEAARARHAAAGRTTWASVGDVHEVRTLVLAFKPQHFGGAVDELRGALASDALVISIMAGISTETISTTLASASSRLQSTLAAASAPSAATTAWIATTLESANTTRARTT